MDLNMTGRSLIIPAVSTAPVVPALHSNGVAGASHRYVTKRATYADGDTFAMLEDVIAAKNLAPTSNDAVVMKAHVESSIVMARQVLGTQDNIALENGTIDMGTAYSFSAVFRVPDVTSTVLQLDSSSLTRAGNGNYQYGGGSGTAAVTPGSQTNGWVVAVGTVDFGSGVATLSINSVTATNGSAVTASSQTDRIIIGQKNATDRISDRDYVELNTWPFLLSTQQKADALAAMRAAYSFVPQT